MATQTCKMEWKLQQKVPKSEIYNSVEDFAFLLPLDSISNHDLCNTSKHTHQF